MGSIPPRRRHDDVVSLSLKHVDEYAIAFGLVPVWDELAFEEDVARIVKRLIGMMDG